MKQYARLQRNITLTAEQQEFIKSNHGKVNIGTLSKMLGLKYNKVHNNLQLMGLVESRKNTAKVVKMDGYFDVDHFQRTYYEY